MRAIENRSAVRDPAQEVPRNTTRLKGLVFEPADVLYDATLWWRWVARFLPRHQATPDDGALARLWHQEYLGAVRRGEREFGEAFEAFLRAAGLAGGEIDEVLAAGLTRRRDLEFDVRPFPRVRATLARLLGSGYRLAVVSNSTVTSDELRERLARMGVEGFFEVVISSIELERTKPDPLGYNTALCRLGLAPDEVFYVAHEIEDLAGARALGLVTVAVGTRRDAPADWHIERFDGLLQLVGPSRVTASAA